MPKVLIVDDDPATVDLLDAYLTRAGYQVIAAKHGHEAITVTLSESPQAIVMDVLMPGMGGLESLRQLKNSQATKAIPVIIITAGGNAQAKPESALFGATVFLTKPLSPAQLLAEIRRLIQGMRPDDEPGNTCK